MKAGMHMMPDGHKMRDSEMKAMMDEYKTPGWAKKSDKMGKPAKKKMKKRSAKY